MSHGRGAPKFSPRLFNVPVDIHISRGGKGPMGTRDRGIESEPDASGVASSVQEMMFNEILEFRAAGVMASHRVYFRAVDLAKALGVDPIDYLPDLIPTGSEIRAWNKALVVSDGRDEGGRGSLVVFWCRERS